MLRCELKTLEKTRQRETNEEEGKKKTKRHQILNSFLTSVFFFFTNPHLEISNILIKFYDFTSDVYFTLILG